MPGRTPSTPSQRWSPAARRLGILSALGVFGIGLLYVAVIVGWLAIEETPSEPIGDPYLAAMEVLTIASAFALVGLFSSVFCYADSSRSASRVLAVLLGSMAAALTMAVHFTQLTAIRQLWRAGEISEYRLIWPSTLFAVEYLAWDVLLGLALLSASYALVGETAHRAVLALRVAGTLSLLGVAGPVTGLMPLQNIAVLGYAVALPIAAWFVARVFANTPAVSAPIPGDGRRA